MADPTEDDETWLYGDGAKEQARAPEPEEEIPAPAEANVSIERKEASDKEAGELSGEEAENKKGQEDDEDEEEEDSDDDDVQVTIGDIKPQTYDTATKFKTGYQRPAAQGSTSITKAQPKGVDIDTQGAINGTPVYEFDIEALQADEKPWRKPGADITDYFNYGFTEETWTKYCERQRRLRMENNATIIGSSRVYIPSNPVHHLAKRERQDMVPGPKLSEIPENAVNEFGAIDFRKAGPPPLRKTAGTIDVIGSTTSDSRRPARDFLAEVVASAEAQDYKKYPSVPSISAPVPDIEMPPVGIPPPDFSTPPPGIPPPGMPVPGVPIHIGPPPMGLPPTGIPPPNMSAPPPGFPPPPVTVDPYESFYPPGHGPPPPPDRSPMPGYDNRDPYGYGPPGPYGGMPNQGPPAWDRGPGDGYNRNWDFRPPGEDDFSRDHYRRDRERSRSRDRERRHRDRERERSERDRERDRDRGAERVAERGADRGDRDREREERHRSRRKRDEDEDHHKSKHKKSKRSKRDREEENAAGSGTGGAGGAGGEGGSSQTDDAQQ